ncbi:hypothetical protein [Paraburkholderia kururiensis]|uniref:Uncharacterized protein n=1 Tax=Paraburkholderia kururiensis TaxID=984307 RepID=A0ABZ0WLS1_9BURK|nr:hypothetical protein [Paraburkholderia kururiensis]WQD78312.1 hypothetical protein U0042_00925 [Paraburkholderia kururiensis]
MSIDEQIPAFLAISEAFLRAADSALPAKHAWLTAGPFPEVRMPCCGLRVDDASRPTRTGSDDTFAAQRA